MTENLFIAASRAKYRFDTTAGRITAEDLWDLPLTHPTKPSLDTIAIALHTKLQETSVSFVSTAATRKTKDQAETEKKLEIVKYVIGVRQEEAEAAKKAADRRERAANISRLITQKEADALGNSSVDELKALLAQIESE